MKKFTLSLIALLIFRVSTFASGEQISWLYTDATGNQSWLTAVGNYGPLAPCNTVSLRVAYTPPSGYSFYQFTWTVNGVVEKISNNVNDNVAIVPVIASGANNMMCQVTYKNSGGGTTALNSDVLDFGGQLLGVIVNQANDAITGCANPVTFTTSTFSQSGFFTPASSAYTVSWVPPTNWVVSSQSSNGQSISFIPDATDGGTILANLKYTSSCAYTGKISAGVTRTTPATSWSASNPVVVCQNSTPTNLAVTPICGASSYTYSLTGSAVFSANSSQSYTTASPNVNVSFPNSSVNTIYATVNYPSGVSSSTIQRSIQYGIPSAPTNLQCLDQTCPEWSFSVTPASAGILYNWSYYNTATKVVTNVGGGSTCCSKIDWSPSSGTFVVQVTATNTCGTGPIAALGETVSCGGTGGHSIAPVSHTDSGMVFKDSISNAASHSFSVFPNPVNNYLKISLGSSKDLSGIQVVSLYNSLGVLMISRNYNNAPQQVDFYFNNLPTGVYFLKVSDNKQHISGKTILISR